MSEIFGYVVGAIAIVGFLIAAVRWTRKRWRRRSQAREVELPNRDELVRAIGEADTTARMLIERQWELKRFQKKRLASIGRIFAMTAAHNAREEYRSAMETLNQEGLVAEEAFRQPIGEFVTCIEERLNKLSKLPLGDDQVLVEIRLKAEETVNKIDAIIAGLENP